MYCGIKPKKNSVYLVLQSVLLEILGNADRSVGQVIEAKGMLGGHAEFVRVVETCCCSVGT